jgi:aryl carrier-like protein
MPEYMIPAHFVMLDALPLTSSGKLNRKALPAPSDSNEAPRAGTIAPRTPTEEMVMAVFREVLDRTNFGVLDNFFELGGHSLMAMRLMHKLQVASGVDLPFRNLFVGPTVAELAELIDGR